MTGKAPGRLVAGMGVVDVVVDVVGRVLAGALARVGLAAGGRLAGRSGGVAWEPVATLA